MDRIDGQGAQSSHGTNRPRIGRTATTLLLLAFTLLLPSAAGAQEPTPEGRVVNGSFVTPNDVLSTGRWSAIVAVFATDAQGTRLCTGTLVAPNWVATAAHCVADEQNAAASVPASQLFVAAGITSTQSAGSHLVGAESARVHPGFSWINAAWDVALIELESTVQTTPFALPDPSRATTYLAAPGDNVAGFGRSQATSSASSGTLRSGRVEQVATAACEAYNPGSSAYSDCYLPGAGRQATCFGDSGGPLVRYDAALGGAPVLWGITSTGPDPCDAATTGQFAPSYETRVTSVVDWLTATMSGSTYVPTTPATSRNGTSAPATTGRGASGTPPTSSRAPVGGTGIGIFRARLDARPSRRRGGTVQLSSSFIGSTGAGRVEIVRCVRTRCTTSSKASVDYETASTTVKVRMAVPRCTPKATITLRLKVWDSAGNAKDQASQRLTRCS